MHSSVFPFVAANQQAAVLRSFVVDEKNSGGAGAISASGRPDLRADQEIQFEISGPGTIAAVGNGDGQDPDSYYSNRRKLYQGRALVVIRSSKQSGPLKLAVKGSGLRDGSLTIVAKAAQVRPEL